MVRTATLALLASISIANAQGVDYRWTLGFGQGTSEAIIRNAAGSSLNIYCPSGQADTTPGMFVEVTRVRPKANERIDIQVVVDGRSHPFYLDGIQFKGAGRAFHQQLTDLARSIYGSRQRTFTVEFPQFGIAERFSLLDAKRAIGRSSNFILSGCQSGRNL